MDASRVAFDVQCVVALRMMRLAEGGPGAASEAQRMVVERSARWRRRNAAGAALMAGSSLETAGRLAAVRSNASCGRTCAG